MLPFDPNKFPYGLDPKAVEGANAAIAKLWVRRLAEIHLAEPPHGYRLSNKIRLYTQAIIRRCLVCVEGGLAEYHAGRPLITDQCSRSIYENVAAFLDFAGKLKPLIEAGNHAGIDDLIMRTAFATRVESWLESHGPEYEAVNVITLIRKLAKKNTLYGEAFERLCDIVHPNGLGSVVYFCQIDEKSGLATISWGGNDPDKAYVSLVLAALLMLHIELALEDLDPMLVKLTASFTP